MFIVWVHANIITDWRLFFYFFLSLLISLCQPSLKTTCNLWCLNSIKAYRISSIPRIPPWTCSFATAPFCQLKQRCFYKKLLDRSVWVQSLQVALLTQTCSDLSFLTISLIVIYLKTLKMDHILEGLNQTQRVWLRWAAFAHGRWFTRLMWLEPLSL